MYFTPNGNYDEQEYDKFGAGKTPDTGRLEKTGKYIYCSAVDIDVNEKVREGVIEPTFIIKTGKGYHIYFMYERPLDYEFDYEDWKTHMDKLYTVLDGDPKCRSNQMQ